MRRNTSAVRAGMGAPLTPLMNLVLEGRTTRSAPIPLVRCLVSFNMPMKMPTMDRIMTTSMATASTLMMERRGRCNRLAKMSLFIPEDGSDGLQNAGNALAFRVTAQGWRSRTGGGVRKSTPPRPGVVSLRADSGGESLLSSRLAGKNTQHLTIKGKSNKNALTGVGCRFIVEG